MRRSSSRANAASSGATHLVALAAAGLLLYAGARPSIAHEDTVPWLESRSLEGGVYVELRHPRVIRRPRSFDLSVLVSNLEGDGPVTVRSLRYRIPGDGKPETHRRDAVLASKRDAYRRFKQIREQLESRSGRGNAWGVRGLLQQRRRALAEIRSGALLDRRRVSVSEIPEAGSSLALRVEVDLLVDGQPRTLERAVKVAVQPLLPTGNDGAWFAGDQHLHTLFSIDAFFLDSTRELISDYATVAESVGLDWIIGTDHTNVNFLGWYQPWMFVVGEIFAAIHRDQAQYLVLQGQEMGVGAIGELGEAAHLLVYPRTANSTGFLPNPCFGLIGNHVNCEAEQVIIDRVNDNGGIGFIAHPFSSSPLVYTEWDREANIVGWAGLEIFNSSAGRLGGGDEQSLQWWYELLREIPPPVAGELQQRPDYPTRFPVGLGNSDAHQPAHIGATFSYAYLEGVQHGAGPVPREALMDAFVHGRIVASNGPLVFAEINGAGTGEVASLAASGNEIIVNLQTTPEFGPVGDYEISVLVDGVEEMTLPPSGDPGFQATILLPDDALAPPDTFVTLRARRTVCPGCTPDVVVREAVSNPIWLEFLPSAPANASR